jgi:hypothetical protein
LSQSTARWVDGDDGLAVSVFSRVIQSDSSAEGVPCEHRFGSAEPLEQRFEITVERPHFDFARRIRVPVAAEVEGDDLETFRQTRREMVPPMGVGAAPVEEDELALALGIAVPKRVQSNLSEFRGGESL